MRQKPVVLVGAIIFTEWRKWGHFPVFIYYGLRSDRTRRLWCCRKLSG